jgi:outer membrane protein OmpA-like peptidoglycan-associated protein
MGKLMQKKYFCLLIVLVALSGCGKKSKKADHGKKHSAKVAQVDIPVADAQAKTFFDEDVNEFNLAQNDANDAKEVAPTTQDYAWANETDKTDSFKVVYFDFDQHNVREDQEETVNFDIDLVKKEIGQAEKAGKKVCVLVEGHACHSAGSAVYNLAKSEKRAKTLHDRLVAAGVPEENIKIVGRGTAIPAIIDGKAVTGDRMQQWPNRRDEIRVINA